MSALANAYRMSLPQLFAGIDAAPPDIEVSGLSCDSRDLVRGDLFLARQGEQHHGLEFLETAVARGCRAVAWEPSDGVGPPPTTALECFPVAQLSARLGQLADRFYKAPSAGISVTGITGTNGKTTIAFVVNGALNALGHASGYMGTLGYGAGNALSPSPLTTPDCVTLHRRLAEFRDAGLQHVITEVSSHALAQERVDGVRFSVAAYSNLSRDHLDYHGTMERYASAKAKLFRTASMSRAVINVGDAHGGKIARDLPPGVDLLSIALVEHSGGAGAPRVVGTLSALNARGIGLDIHGDFGEARLNSGLWGRFNAENLLVAVGILLAHGIELHDAVRALANCAAPPGRMQRIAAPGGPLVIVDFAHTPDALTQALGAIRDHHETGNVWCVFGCGGNRDAGKRSAMGAAAGRADRIVVTSDNPRDESPDEIIADVVAGIPARAHATVVADRVEAIGHAIAAAESDDVVLVAGKGHETQQLVAGQSLQFSDEDAARTALGIGAC